MCLSLLLSLSLTLSLSLSFFLSVSSLSLSTDLDLFLLLRTVCHILHVVPQACGALVMGETPQLGSWHGILDVDH